MKRFNLFGALAQLVEQWPFKPFVTGSNPVRPNYLSLLLISILTISQVSYSSERAVSIQDDNGIILNGNLLSRDINKPIFIIVHGTRGYYEMEIINTLSKSLYDEGFNTLAINFSYGFSSKRNTFLECNITHNHSEQSSVNELILWYQYLISIGYKDIYFIGHSRGALNVMQAVTLINDNSLKTFLLAPMIDTYEGTRDYYRDELKIPYDQIISSDDNYLISKRYKKINFLFCENVDVYSKTYRSYLDLSKNKSKYPFTFNIIDLLNNSKVKSTVFSGTDDEIILDSYKALYSIENKNIKIIEIDGADHFFRDLYLEEIVEYINLSIATEQ